MVFLDCYAIIFSLYQWNKIVLRLQWHIGHSDKYFESVLTNVTDVTASSTVDTFLQRHARVLILLTKPIHLLHKGD